MIVGCGQLAILITLYLLHRTGVLSGTFKDGFLIVSISLIVIFICLIFFRRRKTSDPSQATVASALIAIAFHALITVASYYLIPITPLDNSLPSTPIAFQPIATTTVNLISTPTLDTLIPPTGIQSPTEFLTVAPPTRDLNEIRADRNISWTPIIQNFNGADMTLVPRGCFQMGTTGSVPDPYDQDEQINGQSHQQCIDNPFWIDVYEVGNGGTNIPRTNVTWYEANSFCQNRGARLPTEKEWEFAARGPDSWIYPWGNEFDSNRVVFGNPNGQPETVDSRPNGKSWVGAYNLAGNVWEWTSSLYRSYPYITSDDRENLNAGGDRTIRGGSYAHPAGHQRSSNRHSNPAHYHDSNVGFRCARNI